MKNPAPRRPTIYMGDRIEPTRRGRKKQEEKDVDDETRQREAIRRIMEYGPKGEKPVVIITTEPEKDVLVGKGLVRLLRLDASATGDEPTMKLVREKGIYALITVECHDAVICMRKFVNRDFDFVSVEEIESHEVEELLAYYALVGSLVGEDIGEDHHDKSTAYLPEDSPLRGLVIVIPVHNEALRKAYGFELNVPVKTIKEVCNEVQSAINEWKEITGDQLKWLVLNQENSDKEAEKKIEELANLWNNWIKQKAALEKEIQKLRIIAIGDEANTMNRVSEKIDKLNKVNNELEELRMRLENLLRAAGVC